MAKNRVAPDRPTSQSDKFFTKPRSKFHHNIKYSEKRQKNNQYKFQNKSPEVGNFRPSTSGSDNFFVKPNNCEFSNVSDTSNINSHKHSISTLKLDKKPFDKKKYRLKKYSKKYKLELWEDKRKKAVLRNYYQSVNQDEQLIDVNKIYNDPRNEISSDNDENENNLNADIIQGSNSVHHIPSDNIHQKEITQPTNSQGKKNKAFRKAHVEFENIKEQKKKEKEDKLKKKLEKEEALQTYKQKKHEKFKKLNRKTKRGQPIMKNRIEMLLEKIQNSIK